MEHIEFQVINGGIESKPNAGDLTRWQNEYRCINSETIERLERIAEFEATPKGKRFMKKIDDAQKLYSKNLRVLERSKNKYLEDKYTDSTENGFIRRALIFAAGYNRGMNEAKKKGKEDHDF